MNENKRIVFLDYVRVFACFLVIVNLTYFCIINYQV